MELSLILSIISLCMVSAYIGYSSNSFFDWMQKRHDLKNTDQTIGSGDKK